MCGRYASTRSAADLAELFGVEDLTEGDLVPDYNLAPTDPAPIVVAGELRVARWGFLPSWSRDASGAARMINARAESVATSRAFGEAFTRRRCLVPADGWYEWRVGSAGVKQPYFMTRSGPVVFGGVWSTWGTGVDFRTTFSIITMPAIGELATVHHRMPLLLDESRWVDWLSNSDPATVLTPPKPEYCEGFEIRPVSPAVGDVRKDGPELLRRVTGGQSVGGSGITADDIDPSTVESAPTLF